MAGKTVDLKFRADLSQLVSEMKGLPGMTETEAKKMASSLERQIKKAEKASIKAAKSTGKAWKSQQKSAKSTGAAFEGLAQKLGKVEHVGGETSSVMGGMAGAMNTVSPAAGAAAQTLGDVAGGIEMVMRSGTALAGPLAVLTAGVMLGMRAWQAYNEKQAQAQVELDKTKKRRIELAKVMAALDNDVVTAEIELGIARGDATEADLMAHKVSLSVRKKFSVELGHLQEAATAATDKHTTAIEAEAKARGGLNRNSNASVRAYGAANKATRSASHEATVATNALNALKKVESDQTNRLINLKEARMKSLDALKKSTSGGKRAKSVLQKLREETEKLLPKADLDKVEALSQHLERLEAAASGSKKAAAQLAGSIEATSSAIADLQAKKAAEDLEALAAAGEKLAPPETISRLDELVQMEKKLIAAIAETGDETGRLAETRTAVHSDILEEIETQRLATIKAAGDKKKAEEDAAKDIRSAYMSAYGNINTAASMVAAEMLARAEAQATAEVDTAQDSADARQDQLEAERDIRAQLLDEAAERDVSRELAASDAKIALLTTAADAERANLAATKEQQGAAVRDAFMATKALKLTEIAMNTASSVMAMTTAGPAGLLLAGSVVALGATQAAIVASQEPPSFHLGGIVGSRPDERNITARAGEGVLTRQGVAALGGEGGVAAANSGQGSGPILVQMIYKHKILDEVLSDSVRRGGPIGSAINSRSPRGRRNPHGRRAS
jgi:hypothetical protein